MEEIFLFVLASLRILHSKQLQANNLNETKPLLKAPSLQEATSSLFASKAEKLNLGLPRTNRAGDVSGSRARDNGIASPTC